MYKLQYYSITSYFWPYCCDLKGQESYIYHLSSLDNQFQSDQYKICPTTFCSSTKFISWLWCKTDRWPFNTKHLTNPSPPKNWHQPSKSCWCSKVDKVGVTELLPLLQFVHCVGGAGSSLHSQGYWGTQHWLIPGVRHCVKLKRLHDCSLTCK